MWRKKSKGYISTKKACKLLRQKGKQQDAGIFRTKKVKE